MGCGIESFRAQRPFTERPPSGGAIIMKSKTAKPDAAMAVYALGIQAGKLMQSEDLQAMEKHLRTNMERAQRLGVKIDPDAFTNTIRGILSRN